MRTARRVLCGVVLATAAVCLFAGTERAVACDNGSATTPNNSGKKQKKSKKRSAAGLGMPGCGVPAPVAPPAPSPLNELLLDIVKPEYPQAALEQRIQATFQVGIHISSDGSLADLRVFLVPRADPSFPIQGLPRPALLGPIAEVQTLNDAVVAAVKQWKFKPGTDHDWGGQTWGQSKEWLEHWSKRWATILVDFSLSENGDPIVTYDGRLFWPDAKKRLRPDLVSVYECWQQHKAKGERAGDCSIEEGAVTLRVTTTDVPDIVKKLASGGLDPQPASPSPNVYVGRILLINLTKLLAIREVVAVDMIPEGRITDSGMAR